MKLLLRLAVLIAALGILYFGIKSERIKIPALNLPQTGTSLSPVEWTEEKVLMTINDYRQSKGLGVLTPSEKLNMAAKSRLAVLLEYEDALGQITGLSREKALETVGYSYSWVGDLVVLGFFRSNDLTAYWNSIDNAKQTLDEKNLRDIGVAIKEEGETVSIYVLLGSQAKSANTPSRQTTTPSRTSWGGPDLWAAINKRRVELGVNPLSQKDELCTIAAIRLNQILDLGQLDAHAGFEPTLNREDLKWISEKYNISEFLVSGYQSAADSVSAWENTLGHKKLLAGGEYVWGCVYAQNMFGVAIAAY